MDKYSVSWERAAALDAPIYLHPANPVDHPAMYAGHSELGGPVCSWAFETATHALRLVFAGVFERYPKAAYMTEIEFWSERDDGQIEFVVRRLPSAD